MSDDLQTETAHLLDGITPGEWRRRPYLDAPEALSLTIIDVEGAEVASVRGWAGDRNHDEQDAAFIAAAPRLVRAWRDRALQAEAALEALQARQTALVEQWRYSAKHWASPDAGRGACIEDAYEDCANDLEALRLPVGGA